MLPISAVHTTRLKLNNATNVELAGAQYERLDSEYWIVFLLKLSVCTLFLGRGYLYVSNFSPLTVFFWNQDWLVDSSKLFQIEWEYYALR